MTTVGLLHPGDMGSKVGAAVRSSGSRVVWAGEGRSADTRKRASEGGLEDVGSVAALVRASDVILSVCPPHAAVDVAKEVAGLRFTGTFVDGNAVSPATAREIGGIVEKAGTWYSYEGAKIGQGRDKVLAHLDEHPAIQQQLRDQLIKQARLASVTPATTIGQGAAA